MEQPNQRPTRLPLAQLPTPIHFLTRLSANLGCKLYAWRDDLTGFAESGNKIRKLEFLAAEAIERKATWLVSCGGPQSNHARATAFVARRLGLGVTLVVREPSDGLGAAETSRGNHLLMRILGADIRLVPYADYVARGSRYDSFLEEESERLRQRGETPYVIGEGGSTDLGCYGYFHAAGEMARTWSALGTGTRAPDSIFLALGSGGTYAGLHLGLEALDLPSSRLHAVNVCDDAAYFQKRIEGLFDAVESRYGLRAKERRAQIHEGFVGAGYAKASDDDLRFYAEIARKEGLLLDPCYTGKAFRGMVSALGKDPARYGKHVLFLHSGGGFGNFAYGEQYARALR
jgi:D-cysteine desulfhydrase